jgi:cytochrome c oxidase cbb3-type subunit 3
VAPTDVAEIERANAGQAIFVGNCVACHGEDGKGKHDVGAPDLTDSHWIYGGDLPAIYSTVYSGHPGHMPHCDGRLSPLNLKILALYVLTLDGGRE